MKQGWEIKKLGEVATYVNGYAFKPEHWGETGMPIIRIQNLNNSNAEFNYCDVDIPEKFVVEDGDILISWSASLGVYEWNRGKAYLNQHIFKVVFNKVEINKYFLKYAVNAKLNDMLKDAHGATMKHIVKGDFDNTIIPYPPREEQERIVEELDCLSGVIEKKSEQLKQLDTLAQSIFYQMFGDPITNEKGWEVKKLEEVASEIFAGGDKPKDFSDIQTDEYIYPIYANGEGDRGLLGYSRTYRVESKAVALGARGASIGNCRICEGKFTPVVRLITIIPSNKIDIIYLFYSVRTMSFNISGAGQAQLTTPNVINKSITIPPLSLQQEFADKIEAIEKQKELIKQSITQTEELLNSRIDYYFN